jgi:hypothetical protein
MSLILMVIVCQFLKLLIVKVKLTIPVQNVSLDIFYKIINVIIIFQTVLKWLIKNV